MSAIAKSLAKITIRETPIDWDRFVLTNNDVARFVDPSSLVGQISDVLHARGGRDGVPLPWPGIERLVRLRPGKLSLWAGINFHGKTAMLKLMALHLVKSGQKVCIASLEEDPEETMADMTQMAVPDTDVRETDDWIDVVCGWLSGKLWLYNQKRMMDPQRILALIAYSAQEKGCTHFILDSLMRTGLSQDDYEGQRLFVNQLTNYASELRVHIHLVHHIVKVDEKEVPGRHNIRGGGAITDQADHTFIVWRDTKEDRSPIDPDGILVVAKNRGLRPSNWRGQIKIHVHKSGQFLREKHDKPLQFIDGIAS